jgi:hypothetical protein
MPEMGVHAYPEFAGSSPSLATSDGVPIPEAVPVGQERSS